MRHWLLTTEYPPFYGGGISTYCQCTAQMLVNHGHFVTVFINDSSVSSYIVSETNQLRIVRFNPSSTGASSFLGHVTNLSYEFAHIVKQFIEEEGKPDIIESQEYLGIAYYLLQFKYLKYSWCQDIPIVVTMHSPSFLYLEFNHAPIYRYPNFWIGEMERFCLQAADLIISPSQFLLTEVKKRFAFTNPNIAVVPNPYEPAKHDSLTVDNTNENQIIFFGKLSAQKGTFKLLGYFKEMWAQGFSEPLYLIGGDGIVYHPEGRTMGDIVKRQYKSFINKGLLKLEGKVSPNEIGERLKHAAVVIIPSTIDNLPYVVFEMMAWGRIVLVSDQGGHIEVVEDGINGFIFSHKISDSFRIQLRRILALSIEERKEISQNAVRSVVQNYSYNAIYAKKIKYLTSLVEANHSRPFFPFIRLKSLEKIETSSAGTKNLLSIVIPYYNMGRYIDETIHSLQKANYLQKEIIIINDGSTDELSLKKLNHYRKVDGVRVVDIENAGLANARNHGAQTAKGEYLAFLDSDDTITDIYYQKAIGVLQAYSNVYFVGSWTKYFEGSLKTWPTFTPEPPIILYHNLVNSSALVYKREAFLIAGQNDPDMVFQGLEDYESVIALVSAGYGGVILPEALFNYRVRSDSMIRGISFKKKLFLSQYISNKHKEFYTTFGADLFSLLNANGPGLELDNPTADYHLMDKMPFLGKLSSRAVYLIKKNKLVKTIAYKIYRVINK